MRVLRAITAVGGSVLTSVILLLVAANPTSAATDITIKIPQSGGTIVNTSAQVSGVGPANTLVHVTVTDTVADRPNIAHIAGGRVSGTVTSDKDGQWIYVPATRLVPGQYSAKAYYIGVDNKTINSPLVPFVVTDKAGNTVQPVFAVKRMVGIGLLGFAAVLFVCILILARRNGGRLRSREVARIQRELTSTQVELDQLKQRLARSESHTGRGEHQGKEGDRQP